MMADLDGQSILFEVILLFVLTLINAFFAAAEMALVQVNSNRIEKQASEGEKTAKILNKVLQDPTNFLSTIQVGITLVTLLSGASLAESIAQMLAPLLGGTKLALQIAQVIAMVLLTYISIVFGELYPKRIAMNNPEIVARFAIYPLRFLSAVAKPFVWLLSASTDLLAKLTPMKFDDKDNKMTREEMHYLLAKEQVLDTEELEMVQGVFSLDSKVAREVMVPRPDAFMIDIQDDQNENIKKILSESFSRVPVYDGDKDNIIGILHTKRLLNAAYAKGFSQVELRSILQEPLFVPETIFTDDLIYEFKKTQNQMSILLDEYGGVAGIVTLEDLLEEIVGEIDDESDEVDEMYQQIDDYTYLIQGKMTIKDFNEEFDQHLEMDDVDTLAGYLMTVLGVIPEEGEHLSCEVDNLKLTSEKVEETRIVTIKVTFMDKPQLLLEESTR